MRNIIRSETACCLTGSNQVQVVSERDRHGKPLRTVICTDSGLVFTDPRPTSEQIARFYSDEYRKNYKNISIPKSKHIVRAGRLALKRLRSLQPYLSEGDRLFDIGAGGGEFVYLSGLAGLRSRGVEPNKGYAGFANQEYGIEVENGFYQDAKLDVGSLDCITAFHVLEHLEEPVEALAQLSKFLRPGGHFVVEVPDVDDTEISPSQKWHLGHLYNFNQQTLSAVGISAGLTILDCESRDGVLLAVFKKPIGVTTDDVDSILVGSFETTWRILTEHSTAKHYLRPHVAIGRMTRKAGRNLAEELFAFQFKQPKAILDALFARKGLVLSSHVKAA